MLAMVGFGIGEVLGSTLLGYIVDKLGNKLASIMNFYIVIVMSAITFLFL